MIKYSTRKTMERKQDALEEMLCYAERKYGIVFPKRSKLLASLRAFKTPQKYLKYNKKIIDAIEEEWVLWKDYVSEDSKSSFFEQEIRNLVRNHATATNTFKWCRSYIGNKTKVVTELPELLSTAVTCMGQLCINGKLV